MPYEVVIAPVATSEFYTLEAGLRKAVLDTLRGELGIWPELVGVEFGIVMREHYAMVRQKIYRIVFRIDEQHSQVRVVLFESLRLGLAQKDLCRAVTLGTGR